mgnify:CR=1 FL=1
MYNVCQDCFYRFLLDKDLEEAGLTGCKLTGKPLLSLKFWPCNHKKLLDGAKKNSCNHCIFAKSEIPDISQKVQDKLYRMGYLVCGKPHKYQKPPFGGTMLIKVKHNCPDFKAVGERRNHEN